MKFLDFVKSSLPVYFTGTTALEFGSGIESVKPLFSKSVNFAGIDAFPAPGVDIVSKFHELQLPDRSVDVIVSQNTFQNDAYFRDSLVKAYNLLRPGGLLAFTCATTGALESGTLLCDPEKSLSSQYHAEDLANYYKNVTVSGIVDAFTRFDATLESLFTDYAAYEFHHQLFFVAVKLSDSAPFVPLFPDARLIERHPHRFAAYVACPTIETADDALERFQDVPWMRVILAPVGMYGTAVSAGLSVVQHRVAHWIDADFVGIVPYETGDHFKYDKLGVNLVAVVKNASVDVLAYDAIIQDPVKSRRDRYGDAFEFVASQVIHETTGIHIGAPGMTQVFDSAGNAWFARPPAFAEYLAFLRDAIGKAEVIPAFWAAPPATGKGKHTADQVLGNLAKFGTPYAGMHAGFASILPGYYWKLKNLSVGLPV